MAPLRTVSPPVKCTPLRWKLVCLLTLFVPVLASGQEILTALEYFDLVGDNYAEIEDYIATYTWTDESGSMYGTLYYKRPNLIRIDFESPEDMVLVSDGELFMVYVPAFNVVLQQELRRTPGDATEELETPGTLATPGGLAIMERNFNIAYLEGPEPVPLDENSDLLVTQLRLDRKQVTEGYRQIVVSIDEAGFIRRIVGTMVDWEEVQLDLDDIEINQNIPNARFDYESEADASVRENFLFEPEG
jgi:outer membrane lipoprotein-sorting protein